MGTFPSVTVLDRAKRQTRAEVPNCPRSRFAESITGRRAMPALRPLCGASIRGGMVFLLVAMILPSPGAAVEASWRSGPVAVFGDWIVGCDNVRTCTVLVLPFRKGGAEPENNHLRFKRAANPDAVVEHITLSLGNAGPASRYPSIAFRVDRRRVVTVAGRDFREERLPADALRGGNEAPTRTCFAGRRRIAALLRAMAAGRELTVMPSSGLRQRMSLTGFSAAMRWMDAQQGRTETPAPPALPIARRARGGTKALTETEVKRLSDIVRKRLATEEPGDCNGLNDAQEPKSFTATGFAIDANLAAIALRCEIGGSYNHAVALHGVDRASGSARPLVMEHVAGAMTPAPDEKSGVPIVTNMGFDPATMVLTEYAGGRGLGDCGVYNAWVWDGRQFSLVIRREMSPCRGADRGDWPVTYRALVR